VLVLERAPRPIEKICGEYVGPRAVQDLERLGFGDALHGVASRPLHGMAMVAPDGTEVVAEFADASGAPRHGLAVARPQLDGALLQEARRRGARVELGETVVGVELDGATRAVVVRSRTREWRARLILGADGRFSAVSRALGLALPSPSERGVIHAWLRGVTGLCDRGEMHLLRDGSYLGLDPLADGRLNAGLVVDGEVVAQAARAQDGAARLLAAAAASPALARRFAGAEVDGEVRLLAPMRTRVRAVVAERALLVGDAAGFVDPLTGEGIHLAIAGGELAARAATAALHQADPRAALAGYARAHARLVRAKRWFHPLLQALLRHPAWADHVGRRLRGDPAAARRLLAVLGNLRPPSALLHPEFWRPLLRRSCSAFADGGSARTDGSCATT
jgi:flavin-dependent dehydrogenase